MICQTKNTTKLLFRAEIAHRKDFHEETTSSAAIKFLGQNQNALRFCAGKKYANF